MLGLKGAADWLQDSAQGAGVVAGFRQDAWGDLANGAGSVTGMLANPSGRVGLVLGALRGATQAYSESYAATGDERQARAAMPKGRNFR